MITDNKRIEFIHRLSKDITELFGRCFIFEAAPGYNMAVLINGPKMLTHFVSGATILRSEHFDSHKYINDDDKLITYFVWHFRQRNIPHSKIIKTAKEREKLNDPRPIYDELGVPYSKECEFFMPDNRFSSSFVTDQGYNSHFLERFNA